MRLATIDEREMPAALDQAIRAALGRCFPADATTFSKSRAWHGSAPEYSVVLEKAGRVVAHAGVVQRTIDVGGAAVRVAGVQNVLVLPEWRGKGFSCRVLEAAMAEAGRRGFDGGLLFCVPLLKPVYARCGWLDLGQRQVVRIEQGGEAPLPGENTAMFYPLRIGAFPDGPIHLRGNDW